MDDVRGLRSHAVSGVPSDKALDFLLAGTGVTASRDRSGAIIISHRVQGRADAVTSDVAAVETVVVTGSRIRRRSRDAPTPVIAMPANLLEATTPSNIPDALNKLPIFMAGSTPNNATTGANGRGYNAPGNFLDLRGLGANRTLVLENGHRVPGTFYDTTVDTDMLPQMLMSRVEVVTGGASAVYGSDAVTGVVNFILDTKFNGLKGVLQGGISGRGDVKSVRAGFAGGEEIGSRSHLEWSVEYYNRAAIPDDGARPYGLLGTSIVGNGTSATPYELVFGIRQSNVAPGGLVTTGPFAGQQFVGKGQLAPFNPGIPTTTANFSIGGDGGIAHDEYLLPVEQTAQGFARFDQALGDAIHGYIEGRYAQARSFEAGQIFTNITGGSTVTGCAYVNGICNGTPVVSYSANGSGAQYPITIYRGNPFLPAAAQAQLAATGTTSFQMSRMDNDLMSRLGIAQHTSAAAVTAGLNGTSFGDFIWDTYYTHGESRTMVTTINNVNTARFYAALDAVRDPATGNIVCEANLTAPGAFPGCMPLDLFGQGAGVNSSNASNAALDYIEGNTWNIAHNVLDDFGASVTGTAFRNWAGPVRVAADAEYRLASLDVTTSTPDNSFNPQNLRLAPYGTYAMGNSGTALTNPTGSYPASDLAWFKEVQSATNGSEDIAEANIETDVPLVADVPMIELLSLNGAYRYTSYSAAGRGESHSEFSANTWKLGVEWRISDAFELRAARSRDIRAPTLWDLYQKQVITSSGISDPLTHVAGSANTVAGGNPVLKPEVFRNSTAGLVYTPDWLPNFSATADYFHIASDNAIGAVNGLNPTIQNICLASPGGSSPDCALVVRPISYNDPSPQNFPTLIYNINQNIAKMYAEGMDLELDYRSELGEWSDLAGIVSLRALWTHQPILKSQTLPGGVITNAAGTAAAPTAGTPVDKVTAMLDYRLGRFSLDILERFDSAIHQNANPTLVFAIGDLRPYYQTDLNLGYDFVMEEQSLTAFLNVSNLFNTQGGIFQVPNYTGSPGMNYPVVPYADVIGRYITVGLRLRN